MNNLQKYNEAFISNFEVSINELPELAYNSALYWDSVGHMALIAHLEDAFDIMMDMDDIIDFSTYQKGKEIMAKYDVKIETS